MIETEYVLRPKMVRWHNPDLLAKILEAAKTPLEMTHEVLLWRGFLALKHEDCLYLSAGSHEADIDLLRGFLRIERLNPPRYKERIQSGPWRDDVQMDVCCKIKPTENKNILLHLLSSSYKPSGMIGAGDYVRGPGENHKFGRRVPVVILDPGVALLTKVLPLLRLEVWCSCDGHDKKTPPEIGFSGIGDIRWARVALPQFLPPGDPFIDRWTMRQGATWNDRTWYLSPYGCADDAESVYNHFSGVQRLCRNIINCHWDRWGNYQPHRSMATRAREVCGPKRQWETLNCWEKPDNYIFSEEHRSSIFYLPKFEEEHEMRAIRHGYPGRLYW